MRQYVSLAIFFPTCSVDLLSLPASSSAASSTGTGTGTGASPTSGATSILTEQLPFLTAVIAIAGVALGGAFAL